MMSNNFEKCLRKIDNHRLSGSIVLLYYYNTLIIHKRVHILCTQPCARSTFLISSLTSVAAHHGEECART